MTTTTTAIDEKTDFVSRFINQTTTPAFFDGHQVVTLGMKYDVDQRADGRYFVRESQHLVKAGFERNLSTWCEPIQGNTLESSWTFPADVRGFQFNAAAETYRAQWEARRKAEILAQIEQREKETRRLAELERTAVEHRAAIDALAMAAKWSKAQYPITGQDGKPFKTVTGKTCGVVGVHKSENCQVWNVTHIPSGFLMAQFDTQYQAKIAAVRFAQFNLDRSHVELSKDKALGDLARAMRRTSDVYAQVI